MKRPQILLAFSVSGFGSHVSAAPQAPVEIKGQTEIRRYQRLQKRAKRFYPAEVQNRIEQRVAASTSSAKVLVSPDGRKYLQLEGYLPDIYFRASIHAASNGALLIKLPSPREECGGAFQPQWSPDSKIVSFNEVENQNALFFDAKSGKKLWEGGDNYLYAPQNQTIAMLEHEYIVIRQSRTGKVVRRLPPMPTTYGLVLEFFSPTGAQLYVRGSGTETRRWRIGL